MTMERFCGLARILQSQHSLKVVLSDAADGAAADLKKRFGV